MPERRDGPGLTPVRAGKDRCVAVVLVAAGLALVAVALLDVIWTAAAAGSGAGPLSGRVCARLWRLALAVGRRSDGPRHRFLTVAGIALVVVIVLLWAVAAWVGWAMVFSATGGAVVDADSGEPASVVERVQFAGAGLFTLDSAELSAGAGAWQFARIGATATGVVFVTLAISYFVPVATALAERRELGAYIWSLGDTPDRLVRRGWRDGRLDGLEQHLVALTPMVHGLAERHLTYPVLQYFHSARVRTSTALSLAVLDDALTLLRYGVGPGVRLDPVVTEPLARAVGWYLDTVEDAFVSGAPGPLRAPDLGALHDAGIPIVEEDEFGAAVDGQQRRRCQLAKLLVDDG
ncbi:MAG: two pore domain potassium channel family protein [Acidimicrobiia bacterium]